MRMLSIPVPEIIERIWRDAPPGREATAVNELLRSLRELCADDEAPPSPAAIRNRRTSRR